MIGMPTDRCRTHGHDAAILDLDVAYLARDLLEDRGIRSDAADRGSPSTITVSAKAGVRSTSRRLMLAVLGLRAPVAAAATCISLIGRSPLREPGRW